MQASADLCYLYYVIRTCVVLMVLFSPPAELRSMQEKMQKLQQQLEATQKCADVSRPRHTDNNAPSQKQTSTKSSPATQQTSKTLTSLQQSTRQTKANQSNKTPQKAAMFSSPQFSAAGLAGKVQNKQRAAHQPKTGRPFEDFA